MRIERMHRRRVARYDSDVVPPGCNPIADRSMISLPPVKPLNLCNRVRYTHQNLTLTGQQQYSPLVQQVFHSLIPKRHYIPIAKEADLRCGDQWRPLHIRDCTCQSIRPRAYLGYWYFPALHFTRRGDIGSVCYFVAVVITNHEP